jgi:hypothetical protein
VNADKTERINDDKPKLFKVRLSSIHLFYTARGEILQPAVQRGWFE